MLRRGGVVAFAVTLAAAVLSPLSAGAASGNSIQGRVTAAATGAPIAGICVYASSVGDPHFPSESDTTTGPKGNYTLENLAPGVPYQVTFTDCQLPVQRYAGQNYPSLITASGLTNGVSAALKRAGTLTGTLTDPVSGLPASNVCLEVDPYTPGMTSGLETDAAGRFRATGLAPGVVKVAFATLCNTAQPYAEQWYHDQWAEAEADPVTIRGGTTSDVSETLLQGQVIAGRVTDAATGLGLIHLCVFAAPTAFGQGSSEGITDATGHYRIGGLEPGVYKVEFLGENCSIGLPHQNEWWNDKPDFDSADPITVSATVSTTGIDAALQPL